MKNYMLYTSYKYSSNISEDYERMEDIYLQDNEPEEDSEEYPDIID